MQEELNLFLEKIKELSSVKITDLKISEVLMAILPTLKELTEKITNSEDYWQVKEQVDFLKEDISKIKEKNDRIAVAFGSFVNSYFIGEESKEYKTGVLYTSIPLIYHFCKGEVTDLK